MTNKFNQLKIKGNGISLVAFIFIVIVCFGFSWIATCGIVKLITMCFGFTFSWKVATGIWLIICLVSSIFPSNHNNK